MSHIDHAYAHAAHLGDAAHLPLPDKCVDLVVGSPPYLKARDYGMVDERGRKVMLRDPEAWVNWMVEVSEEMVRVCKGLIIWAVRGELKSNNYRPAAEGLIWRWYVRNRTQFTPCIWAKNGMTGSGGPYWFRNDFEFLVALKASSGPPPFADPLAMGSPPKYPRGGRLSHRTRDGSRVDKAYPMPTLANPGNVVRFKVGGGHMGDKAAHESEAPFPESLPEWFIRTHSRPGDVVLDPFCGSGTTLVVAKELGRVPIGFDCRQSQVDLSNLRLECRTPKFPAMR